MVELEIISSADEGHVARTHDGLSKIVDAMQRVLGVWVVFGSVWIELVKILCADNILTDSVLEQYVNR